jgi:tetratricopeptide (TPR) repeat protein
MPLRRSISALALTLCNLSATGCENGSFEFKGTSISFSQNYIKEGAEKFEAGDYEGALVIFIEMVEQFPEDAQGYINKSGSLINLNRLPEALEATNKAIEVSTKDPISKAYKNQILIIFRLKNSPEAMKEVLKSINKSLELSLAATNADPYNLRGIIKQNMGDSDGVLNDFSKAIELDENYARG